MAANEFPLSLVIKAIDKATAPLQGVTKKVGGMAAAAAKAGKVLSVGVSLPVAGALGASIKAFADFEEGLSNVSTLIDTSVESVADISNRVREMGRAIPIPLGDLVDGLTAARSAGVSAADQFQVLEGSAKLAMVGQGKVSEAVDIVTSAMNSWNLTGEKAAGIYNTIFQATNVGKASIADLTQGFGAVAGTVASSGVSLTEFMASVAALTTTGLPASEAYRQLRAVVAGLTRQTEISKPLFDHLGAKSFKDLIAKSGGLVPALNRIKTAVRGDEALMLKLLGSTQALNAVLGLTGNQADAFRNALGLMEEGGDTFEEKFQDKTKTFKATMQSLQTALRDIGVSVGGALAPVLQALAPKVQALADWWGRLGSGTQTAIIAFGVAAAALGPVLTVVGNVGSVFATTHKAVMWAAGWGKYLWMMRASLISGLVPSLVAATSSVWAFTAALLANPITWIIVGIVALAGAVYLISKNWDWIVAFFKIVWGKVKEIFSATIEWIKKHLGWTPLGLILNNWEPIKQFFADLWEGIVGYFEWAWKTIKAISEKVWKVAQHLPLGWAVKRIAGLFEDGEAQRPTIDVDRAAPPAGPRSTEAHVTVDFNNLPKGTRVSQDPRGTAPLDLSMGYSMVTP